MDYYQTVANFSDYTGAMPVVYSVATAVPLFFPLLLLFIWIALVGASYFGILRTTGTRRFFQVTTALSFVAFIVSILLASMNTSIITVLSGYWVAFYLVMVAGSWYGLTQYR